MVAASPLFFLWFSGGTLLFSSVCPYLLPVSMPLYILILGKISIKCVLDSKPLQFVLSINDQQSLVLCGDYV